MVSGTAVERSSVAAYFLLFDRSPLFYIHIIIRGNDIPFD